MDEPLLRTKLIPPCPPGRILPRPALTARLREALQHRLTIVHAGTGYGKSTALAALAGGDLPVVWYTLGESDSDLQRFLSYLVAAFRERLPALSDAPHALLHEGAAWTYVVDALINALNDALDAPTLFVMDDFHFIASSPEILALTDRFIAHGPRHLHAVLATRYPVNLPGLVAWRAKGEALEIGREALAFQPDEIAALYRDAYDMQLSPAAAAALADKTEGWPIALQLIWQGARALPPAGSRQSGTVTSKFLAQLPSSLDSLFAYLAQDVLERQPPAVADFLHATSILRELTPEACAAISESDPAQAASMLARLHESSLFMVALGERHYRYHHLFHDFLRARLDRPGEGGRRDTLHARAAAYFSAQANADEAIYHWLSAGEFAHAADAMAAASEDALRAGRLDTVAQWIDALPPDILAGQPALQAALADVQRLRSRFDEALAWYTTAEAAWRARGDPRGISRALRGQALVYLDTVRPAQAASLLEAALRLTDGDADRDARARLLELMAENKLNMGKPHEAEALRNEATTLREEGRSEDVLSVRVKLRTGRLHEAQAILDTWAASERDETHAPRAHRETVLLLSLILSFRGDAERAHALAREGIALGEKLHSPFVTTVAHIRLGHAAQLRPAGDGAEPSGPSGALACYRSAIALGDQLAVRRTRAEAMWGLTRAHGFFGDLAAAQRAAAEGGEIGRWAGDPWIVALIELTLGASHVLHGDAAASLDILSRVLHAFREVGDSFGRAATRLWQCLAYLALDQKARFAPAAEELLALCEAHGYDFLFTTPTLLGPPDPRILVPVLLEARAQRIRPAGVARLLAAIGVPAVEVHPGYQLRVQTLGAFRVWRGAVEVGAHDWQRDKARQLLQLLITRRAQWMQRDEILEALWSEQSADAAARNFKAALNALNNAIEPARRGESFAFVARDGAAYRLRPEADLWLDCAEFARACELGLQSGEAAIRHLLTAAALYRGDFLPDARYEDWASDERERMLSLYLRAADRLAELLIERRDLDEGLAVCESILARDACWERAYRLMMTAYARQGNRVQALRTYRRCVEALRRDLDIAPAPSTTALHDQIRRQSRPPARAG